MFVRQKKNKSGVISVQIIDKSLGKYKVLHSVGSSADASITEKLVLQAKQWIKDKIGLVEFDFTNYKKHTALVLEGISQIFVHGTELLLGNLFNEIGFNEISDSLFKLLVIARLNFPASKLKTSDYLLKYHFIDIDVQNIYCYLDKLYNTQKEQAQQISYNHTLKILHNKISVVFYDVTTLYFEADGEDDLRKKWI